MATYLSSRATGNGVTEFTKWGLMFGPDAIVSGLGVSTVSGLTVRLAPGSARAGGWGYENPSNLDISSGTNLTGSAVVDRLILRRSIDLSNPADPVVTVTPVIVRGSAPIGPSLTTAAVPGVWEIPIARWSVSTSNVIGNLTTDGPGPGGVTFTHPQYATTSGLFGFDGLESNVTSAWGPRPCSISGRTLYFSIGAAYDIEFSAAMPNGNYIRLPTPDEDILEEFGTRGRARIHYTGWIPAGTSIEPMINQTTGGGVYADLVIRVTRQAGP